MCIATVVERSRISERSPGSRTDRLTVVPRRAARRNHTVPTGLSGVPPPGPATPVIETAVSGVEAVERTCGHRLSDLL